VTTVDATAAEINAAADGDTEYRLTGYITSIAKEDYGNLYIKDATGEYEFVKYPLWKKL
jgi:hypothetical protein